MSNVFERERSIVSNFLDTQDHLGNVRRTQQEARDKAIINGSSPYTEIERDLAHVADHLRKACLRLQRHALDAQRLEAHQSEISELHEKFVRAQNRLHELE